MKKLKVLHVVASLRGGGVENLLVRTVRNMNADKIENSVCCISQGGIYEEDLRKSNIPYTILNRHARIDPSLVFQLALLMQRQKIDVVHTLNFTANAWGRAAAIIARVPRIIAHERGTAWTESKFMQRVDRWLYPFTDLLLANSEAAKIILTTRIGLASDRIRVVYNGLPQPIKDQAVSLRQRLGIPADSPVVAAIGRFDTPKGQNRFLEAVPKIQKVFSGTHFALIGDGPLRPQLTQLSENLGLLGASYFHMPGFLPHINQELADVDILVHPSIRESLGNVLIEAGWSHVPVVASNVDGIPEVIQRDRTGILVECTEPVEYRRVAAASPLPEKVVDGSTRRLREPLSPDPQELADATCVLLNDQEKRKEMGQKGYERVRQYFNLERYIQDLEKAYLGELE